MEPVLISDVFFVFQGLKFIRPGGQACLPIGKFVSCALYSLGFRNLIFGFETCLVLVICLFVLCISYFPASDLISHPQPIPDFNQFNK